MIRDFRIEDVDEVNEVIQTNVASLEIGNAEGVSLRCDKFLVFDQNGTKGIAYVTISRNDANEKEAQVNVFVKPAFRLQGIGTALYKELEGYLIDRKPDVISAYTRVDIENHERFCNKVGFHKWWGSPELVYEGERFPEGDHEFERYDDAYFDQFVKMVQDAFYEVNKSNDIKPYLATEESVRKYQLGNKENVFLLVENGEILASVTIGDGSIVNLMVSPRHQGKGLGKKALQFGMNQLLDRGYEKVSICYMEGNRYAEKLYDSLGFKPVQTTHVYRKFL
ncbi:GNAT family N-acetyltransferase [Guptibacillus algicola]|uniref:GNAT family N-acetyltransferase n=1 Tax=Guptibacillus algicola TaxID=225844 RepID=UPI001CD2E91D|nr:GNAT family N-acetyltransferase [Alkalihalobacillus algicola]MCA0987157.1 GNAT family N-acetyltransferase [Alkalihalobacillus algicola]